MKLICLPYAGAHVNVFSELQKQMNRCYPSLGVISLEYPGHGRRFSEKPAGSIKEITADLFSTLQKSLDKSEELLLLGYSMGSIIAYELAQLLIGAGYTVSKLLLMAATPPHRIEVVDEAEPDDETLLERCQIYGLIKEGQFASAQMRQLFLPALRSDITAVNRYNLDNQYHCHFFQPEVEIAVFQGLLDKSVTAVADWRDISISHIYYYSYPSGHFFYYEFQEKVFADIISFVKSTQSTQFKGGSGS